MINLQTVGLFGRVISPSQGRYLSTGQYKHRIKTHTDIHALCGIRTYDPSVRASEDISCLRPLGYCDQLSPILYIYLHAAVLFLRTYLLIRWRSVFVPDRNTTMYSEMCTFGLLTNFPVRITYCLPVYRPWGNNSGRTNRLLSFNMTRTAKKTRPPTILRFRGNVFTEFLPSNNSGMHRQTHRHTRRTILLLLRVFFVTGTCLSSRYLATKGWIHYRHTDWLEGFMKYAAEMSSGAMIYIPSFIKIGSGIRKLIGLASQTHRQHGGHISLLRKVG
jgi:hypothetical protein